MKKLLTLTFALLTFSAMASDFNVKDLKVGDRLEGVDNMTKRECVIDVIKKDIAKSEIVFVVNGKEDEEYRLKFRKGLFTYEYAGQLYDYKDPKMKATIKAQAVLKTGKLSDRTTFRVVQEVYYENHFVLNTLVNCLSLKEV